MPFPRLAPMSPAAAWRRTVPAVLAAAAAIALAAPAPARAAGPAAGAGASPLVIVSTSDVHAKTVPCGCHIPKGGLARRAAFDDSLRKIYPNLLVVDTGGFFPAGPSERDDAPFVTKAMHAMRLDAVGLSDQEFLFGLGFLEATMNEYPLPLVCANLWRRAPHRTLAQPFFVRPVGPYKVGVFGLISPRAQLGSAADTLEVSDPTEAARSAVTEMRKRGAQVIVLLSSLGKMDTESLVLAVPGIDVAIAGRNVPLMQRSRLLDHTTVVFGGEEGQFAGVTKLDLDASGRIESRDSEVVMLGPDVRDEPAMGRMVGAWEARPDVKARRARPGRAPRDSTEAAASKP